jgi:hypothetical protein
MPALAATNYLEVPPKRGFGSFKGIFLDAPKYVAEKGSNPVYGAIKPWFEPRENIVVDFEHFLQTKSSHFVCMVASKHVSTSVEDAFKELSNRWREETEFLSSPYEMSMNESYQQIIGLGESVVHLILQDLVSTHDHWFWALKAITRQNPVNDQDAGDITRMANSWIAWGKEKGYL